MDDSDDSSLSSESDFIITDELREKLAKYSPDLNKVMEESLKLFESEEIKAAIKHIFQNNLFYILEVEYNNERINFLKTTPVWNEF